MPDFYKCVGIYVLLRRINATEVESVARSGFMMMRDFFKYVGINVLPRRMYATEKDMMMDFFRFSR